jgi:hypothetical protein
VSAAASGHSGTDILIHAAIGAGVGALSGALSFGVGAGLASLASYAAWNAAATGTRYLLTGMLVTAVSGAVDGAATGAGTQILGNLADGKRGSEVYDGWAQAMVIGATTGFAVGALGSLAAGGYTLVRTTAPRLTVLNTSLDTVPYSTMRSGRIVGSARWDSWGPELAASAVNGGRAGSRLEVVSHGVAPHGNRMLYRNGANNFLGIDARLTGTELAAEIGGGFSQIDLVACYLGRNSFAQDFATATGTLTRASTGVAEVARPALTTAVPAGDVAISRFARMLVFHPSPYKTGLIRVFGF